MKNRIKTFIVILGSLLIFSCVPRHKPHHVPPGHAKKITNSKSAKPHAPGQVKKMEKKKHPKPPKPRKPKRP